jgi:hypothetical protein
MTDINYHEPLPKAERDALGKALGGSNVPDFHACVQEATSYAMGYYRRPVVVFRDLHTGKFGYMLQERWNDKDSKAKRTHQKRLVTITPHSYES